LDTIQKNKRKQAKFFLLARKFLIDNLPRKRSRKNQQRKKKMDTLNYWKKMLKDRDMQLRNKNISRR
jgi:hypothetical protein